MVTQMQSKFPIQRTTIHSYNKNRIFCKSNNNLERKICSFFQGNVEPVQTQNKHLYAELTIAPIHQVRVYYHFYMNSV